MKAGKQVLQPPRIACLTGLLYLCPRMLAKSEAIGILEANQDAPGLEGPKWGPPRNEETNAALCRWARKISVNVSHWPDSDKMCTSQPGIAPYWRMRQGLAHHPPSLPAPWHQFLGVSFSSHTPAPHRVLLSGMFVVSSFIFAFPYVAV